MPLTSCENVEDLVSHIALAKARPGVPLDLFMIKIKFQN